MNKKFAFVSRHVPSAEQIAMAAEQGVDLIHVGDADAFSVDSTTIDDMAYELYSEGPEYFVGVVVVHPAAALRLNWRYPVGVFENGQRSEDGGKLTFYPKAFHIFPSPIPGDM